MDMKRADIILVERGLYPSRTRARAAIEAGLVSVNGARVEKPSQPVAEDAQITGAQDHPWVSRGGVKLAAALDHFAIAPQGRTALDIGASTGGFSQVLLARGAARVYAVDVGHGQLHADLRADPRLVTMEGQDARGLTTTDFSEPPSLITFDASFIPLALLLAPVLALAADRAQAVLLIKPQFEAGPALVKKGIVRDSAVHAAVCAKIERAVEALGWRSLGLIPSPITGGEGNVEFLLGAQR